MKDTTGLPKERKRMRSELETIRLKLGKRLEGKTLLKT